MPTVRLPAPHQPTARYEADPYTRYYADDPVPDERWSGYQDDLQQPEYEPERRPRRRGQGFSLLVLVLAAAESILLWLVTYRALASVDFTSAEPFGRLGGHLGTFGLLVLATLVVFVLALLAMVVARPKALAGLALLASVLLPIAGVGMGVWYGGDALRRGIEESVSATGPAIDTAVDRVVDEIERRIADLDPLRDLLPG